LNIVDMKEMALAPPYTNVEATGQKTREEADLWTNNRRFVNGLYAMFESLWKARKHVRD